MCWKVGIWCSSAQMIRFDFAWGHLSEHVAANEKPTSLRHGQLRLASLGKWYPGQLILFGPFTAHVSIGVSGRELGGEGEGDGPPPSSPVQVPRCLVPPPVQCSRCISKTTNEPRPSVLVRYSVSGDHFPGIAIVRRSRDRQKEDGPLSRLLADTDPSPIDPTSHPPPTVCLDHFPHQGTGQGPVTCKQIKACDSNAQ